MSRRNEVDMLKERVTQLEKEQAETRQALEDVSTFLNQMTLIVSTLATEMANTIEAGAQEDDVDKLLRTYFPNDDDGYIH